MRRCVAVSVVLALAGCGGSEPSQSYATPTGGDPARGLSLIRSYGCGSCHVIPGVRGARGLVGSPLDAYAQRTYIAGELPNNAENLVRWIKDPTAIVAGTAMPPLGVTDVEAHDIAAYLYSVR